MCEVCKGTGAVVYKKIIEGIPHDFGARCNCPAGMKYKAFPTMQQVGIVK